ncbi:4836_t:CDS:2, partial [Gigaspora rosea]
RLDEVKKFWLDVDLEMAESGRKLAEFILKQKEIELKQKEDYPKERELSMKKSTKRKSLCLTSNLTEIGDNEYFLDDDDENIDTEFLNYIYLDCNNK